MPETVFAIVVAFVMSAGVATALILLSVFVGPRKPSPVKQDPFECGNPPSETPHGRLPVHFYRIAILFVLFDVEIAFFYPWAVRYRDYGWFGFWEMLVFSGFLITGYAYLWAKGMLKWD